MSRALENSPRPTKGVLTIQQALSGLLDNDALDAPVPWRSRESFEIVRTLIGVSTAVEVQDRLQDALRITKTPVRADRMRFEHTRIETRVSWLEAIGAWMTDWPRNFRIGAMAANLTQQSFARRLLPASLVEEVNRLPRGTPRDRTWIPVLEVPELRRLRREAPAKYRESRAKRILTALDWGR